jgi:hypothetical protein
MGGLLWCNVQLRLFDVVKGIVSSVEHMGDMLGSVCFCVFEYVSWLGSC